MRSARRRPPSRATPFLPDGGVPCPVSQSFEGALAECVQRIPAGRVATCGVVARALGDVRAARAVAEWVRDHPELDPSGQVVRADGRPVVRSQENGSLTRRDSTQNERVDPRRFVDHLESSPLLAEPRAQQRELETRVREVDDPGEARTFGGVDVAYVGQHAYTAAVLMDATSLELLEIREKEIEVDFPYIPSYLAFREFPAIQGAIASLREKPDVLFIDGHGRLHPALFGFACYVGVSLDVPTIGIAKHPLAGRPVPTRRAHGDAIPVEIQGEVRGFAWRPPGSPRAFYVSVGHRVSLLRALRLAQQATRNRYPEPLRVADRIAKEGKRKKKGERLASAPAARRRLHGQDD